MSAKLHVLAAAVLVLLTSGWAHAATDGPHTTTTPIASTLTDWSNSLSFPKFNSALGTLTSVRIQLSGTITTTLTVTNNAVTPSNGDVQTRVRFTARTAGNTLTNNVPSVLSDAFAYNLLAGGTVTTGAIVKSGTSDNSYAAAGILAEFTGTGAIVLPATTATVTVLDNTGGNTTASQVTQASLTGTVTYTYTPLPDLTIDKTHAGVTFNPGGTVTFTLTPNNIGTAITSGVVTITDTLPAGLTATSISGGAPWTCVLGTLTCTSTGAFTHIAAGGTGTQPITLVATIGASTTGVLVNNTAVSGGGETNTTNNTDTDSITVTVPDLTIDKTHAGTTFNPGGTVTFTLTPNNVGNATTSGTVTITDTLPAGLTATSISGGAPWTCVLGTLTCTSTGAFTHIAAGGTGTQPITLVAAIGASTTGALVNNTAVSGGGETNTTNNTDTDSITVTVPDLTIDKTHAGTSFSPGGTVTFTLTPSNVGNATTSGTVTITDTLPAGLTATSISGGAPWTCVLGTLTCTSTGAFTHIAASSTGTQPITLVAAIGASTTGTLVNNTAVSGGGEINTTNNTDTDSITVTVPDLTIDKTHAGTTFNPGGTVTFTLTPNNVGNATTSGTVTITDTLPAGLTATSISGGAPWTCVLGTLTCTSTGAFTHIAAGGTGTQPITLVAAIGASTTGTLVNNTAVSGGGEINTTNNTDTDSITVGAASEPDLTIDKTHAGVTFNPGGTVTFTLTPNNVGNATTSGTVTITDTLPAGLTATSISGGAPWTCVLGTLTCTSTGAFTHIAAASTGTQPITLVATIGASTTGTLVNNTAVSGGGEINTTNNTDTDSITVTVPDLTIDKTHAGTSFSPGGTVTFTLTPNNVGNATTSGTVTITDTLPAGLTATSISGGAPWTCVLGTLTCTSTGAFTHIAAASTGTQPITLVATIGASTTGTLVNNTAVSGGGEINTTNNTDTDSITVAVPDLTLSKTHTGTSFAAGGSVTFTMTPSNVGSVTTSGTVTITDTLPSGLTATALSGGAAWTCVLGTLTCTSTGAFVHIAAGGTGSQPITLTATIGAGVTGTLVNTGVVGGGGELNTANNTATDSITVGAVSEPDLVISKTHEGVSFSPGGSVTFTMTPRNIGTATTTGTVSVSDSLPSGLTATAISGGSAWTCSLGSLACSSTASFTHLGPGVTSAQPITLTATIDVGSLGSFTNNVRVDGGGESNTANNTASDTISVSPPDLVLSKTHAGSVFVRGGAVTFTLTPANVGITSTRGTVKVTDTLPTGLRALSISGGSAWTCTLSPLECLSTAAFTPIPAGGTSSQPITLVAEILNSASGTLTNRARVHDGGEVNTANNDASDAITVNALPDMTIAKSHSGSTFSPGGSVTFSLLPSNVGGSATDGTVTVTDTLPAGLTATSISGAGWTCAALPTLSCSRSDVLAAGAAYPAISLTASIAGNASGTLVNNTRVDGGGETNTANNTASDSITITGLPDLTISKSHTDAFVRGGTATYSIVVSNVGAVASSGTITVTDSLPAGLTATGISGGSTWSCTLAPLACTTEAVVAAGASLPAISLSVDIAGDAPETMVNVTEVSGGGETNTTNNRAEDPATVTGLAPRLSLAKTRTGNLVQGGSGVYILTVTNIGTAPTVGEILTVSDPLAPGLTGTGMSGEGWTCALATLSCTRSDSLPAGASFPPINVAVRVAPDAPSEIINVASVTTPRTHTNFRSTATNSVLVLRVTRSIKLDKTADRLDARLGDVVGYTIRVENESSTDFTGAVVDDLLPDAFEYLPGSSRLQTGLADARSLEPVIDGGSLNFTVGLLRPGEAHLISYLVRVRTDARSGNAVNCAQVTASSPTGAAASSPSCSSGVRVDARSFSTTQFLLGRVFEDLDLDGVFDRDERPVAGARIYLSNGMSATTDPNGLYNIPYVAPGSLVVALDSASVPPGYKISDGNRVDAQSWSRLIRTPLLGGAMLRQNFGLTKCPCDPATTPVTPPVAAAPDATSTRPPARLEILPGQETLPGDGRSSMRVRVRVLDDQGAPTRAREVRLRTSAGQFVAEATTPRDGASDTIAPGGPTLALAGAPLLGANIEPQGGLTTEQVPEAMQAGLARAVSGEASFLLLAANTPGVAHLEAETGDPDHRVSAAADITFTPERRTPILVTNGEFSVGRAAPDVIAYGQTGDTQRHLEAFFRTPVGSNALMTLAYQSELDINRSNGNLGLFQLDPLDRVYPVFGDSSTRFQAAQSNSKVYGRLDFGRSYALFGDMRMGGRPVDDLSVPSGQAFAPSGLAQSGAPQQVTYGVGDFGRKVVGATVHLENRHQQSLTVQGARPDTAYARDVFTGSAFGMVQLSHADVLPASETGVVEVRDARNPEILLSRETLVRSVDYTIDTLSGGLFLLRSLNAYDQSLNLVRVVFTYEYQSIGERSNLYAARTDLRMRGMRLGLGITDQEEPGGSRYTLGSLTMRQAMPRAGRFSLEIPVSRGSALAAGLGVGAAALENVNGAAVRADLDQPLGKLARARASFSRTDRNFFNPFGATAIPGAQTGRATMELTPGTGTRLLAGFTDERNETSLVNNQRQTGSVEWSQALFGGLSLRTGYDFRDFQDSLSDRAITSHLVAAGVDLRVGSRFAASARREENVGDQDDPTYPTQTLLSARYQATETARLFVTQRLADAPILPIGDLSTSGFAFRPSRNQTTIGVEDRWGRYSSIQSRYQIEDGLNGTDAFAVIGLANRIPVGRRFNLDLGGERGQHVQGSGDSFNAGSVGFSWMPEANLRTSTRYEIRDRDGVGHIFTSGISGKLSEGLTVLGRFQLSSAAYQNGMGAIDLLRPLSSNRGLGQQSKASHGTGALAWRPWKTDREAILLSYTRRTTDLNGLNSAPWLADTVQILSTDGFYQPSRFLELYGKFALSDRSSDYVSVGSVSNRTWLSQARAQARVHRRFDLAIEGRYIAQPDTSARQYTAAAEGGFWVTSDLRAGVGYNFKSAELLAENFLTGSARRGVYLVLSTKLSGLFNLFPSATLDRDTCQTCGAAAMAVPVVVQPIAGAQDVCTGDTLVLRTTASGGAPGTTLRYQWFVDGQPVSGATEAAFTLSAIGAAGTKTVTVRATAGDQEASAPPVSVTVRPLLPPTVQFTVSPSTVPYGAPAFPLAATATAANICNGTLTLAYSGEAVTGASFNPAAVGGFDPANLIREQTRTIPLTATVRDGHGQTASAVAPVTITLRPAATRRDIVFANASARVNNAAKRYLLEDVAPRLRDDPSATVVLVGHRDAGETGMNLATLDRRRMLNTAAVLTAGTGVCAAVDLSRVQVATVGTDQAAEPRPFGEASVREGAGASDTRAPFRRVEVWVVPGGAERPSVAGLQLAPVSAIQPLGCPK